MSHDLLILVAEAGHSVGSVDFGWRAAGEWPRGRSLIEGAVRPVTIVMALEFAEYGCRVS
jgi:hypothetical protein